MGGSGYDFNHVLCWWILGRNKTEKEFLYSRDCSIFPKIYVQSITKITKQKRNLYVTRNFLSK